MNIGVLKEINDNRVFITPETVVALEKMNVGVFVESKAGSNSFFSDDDYRKSGATINTRSEILNNADVVTSIDFITTNDIKNIRDGKTLICILGQLPSNDMTNLLTKKKLNVFGMEFIPRISRAQTVDVLSSMATVAGYKAVIDAASFLPKFFPMFMSAAGTIKPAKMLILGAGVAGLQALAIARKLGAVVEVFDVRSAVKEEVKSLGGKFIEVTGAIEDSTAGGYAVEQTNEYRLKQQKLIHDHAVTSDVIITTAQILGKKAPVLIKKETVEMMKPGSVIIDLAASTGGNCELTLKGETIEHNKIKIVGKTNYPSEMPMDASSMLSKNLYNFLKLLVDKNGQLAINFEDEIVSSTCIMYNGEVKNMRLKELLKV